MVRYYCKKRHGADGLCAECNALLDYSLARLDACRYGDEKPSCKRCPTHCYRPDMRSRIRSVMKFVGPRMIYLMPLEALRKWFY